MIAPSGQRLPRSTAMPVSFLNGFLNVWMTSRFQQGASLLFSQIERPFAVSAPLCSLPASPSSRITAGTPPA